MIITELWRFPVKSLQGHTVTEAELTVDGISGDRAWSLVDLAGGLNLTARREPRLLQARATLNDDGQPIITTEAGEIPADDDALSRWLGYPVSLSAADASTVGTYETRDETETGPWFQWQGPTGSFHDSTRTKLSLVSETTLGSWDRRRFRINVIVALEDGEDHEDTLVGQRLQIGPAEVTVTKQVDRCVMVTRPQPGYNDRPDLGRDLSVLKTINADRSGFLGIGTLVDRPGSIRVGDRVSRIG